VEFYDIRSFASTPLSCTRSLHVCMSAPSASPSCQPLSIPPSLSLLSHICLPTYLMREILYPGWMTVGVLRCVRVKTMSTKSPAAGTGWIFLKLYTTMAAGCQVCVCIKGGR